MVGWIFGYDLLVGDFGLIIVGSDGGIMDFMLYL